MRALTLVLLLFSCSPAHAEQPPAIPEDARPMARMGCSDNETGQKGICEVYLQPNGDIWMLFLQNGQPVLLRYTAKGQPYITAWKRPEPTF